MTDPADPTRKVDDLVKLQFDYAWKWFDFHAKQRTTLFNYYLIIAGILANALVTSYKEHYDAIIQALGALGAVTSLAFMIFDVRNRDMAAQAENVLEKLEEDVLFPTTFTDQQQSRLGLLLVERRTGMREGGSRTIYANILKHKWWIRGIQIAVGIAFALAALFLR